MLTLARYEAVSNQPATNRGLSICVGDPDMELLGDRIRNVLGERSVGGERGVALSIRLRIGSRKGA
jgi:hypothetical protein